MGLEAPADAGGASGDEGCLSIEPIHGRIFPAGLRGNSGLISPVTYQTDESGIRCWILSIQKWWVLRFAQDDRFGVLRRSRFP
jgi:hypothetical protein